MIKLQVIKGEKEQTAARSRLKLNNTVNMFTISVYDWLYYRVYICTIKCAAWLN